MPGQVDNKEFNNYALRVNGLYKYYPVITSPLDGIRYLFRIVAKGIDKAVSKSNAVKALDDLSFNVRVGERVGIVGRNGAGKSTLLEIIGGKLDLSGGEVAVYGKVYTIASGHVGFDQELSAYKNSKNFLQHQGILGQKLEKCLKEIEEFVELGEFFHQPIKTYSLGMRVRAEFAAATAVNAEIISIDEVLGAGDIYWAEKCARRMENLCKEGSTLLLVSHSLDQVLRYCDRTIWVENGKVMMDGPTEEVIKRYEVFLERMSWYAGDVDDKSASIAEVLPELGDVQLEASKNKVVRWPGRGDIVYTGLWLNGSPSVEHKIESNEPIRFSFSLKAIKGGVYNLRYCVTFWSLKGKRMGILENQLNEVVLAVNDKHEVEACIPAGIVGCGDYKLSFSLFDISRNSSTACETDARQDVIYKSMTLSVVSGKGKKGNLLKPSFSFPLETSIN